MNDTTIRRASLADLDAIAEIETLSFTVPWTKDSFTAAFESEECQARDNRRILYNAMLNVGFTNYPSEWWHYDFGDLFWGAMTQEDVIYPSVYSIDDVLSKLLVTV